MNAKIMSLFIMLLLLVSPAFAAITVTITAPATGTVYNNLPANAKAVPITFTIADDNAVLVGSDMNFNIRYGPIATLIANNAGTDLINDANLFDYNTNGPLTSSTMNCVIVDHAPTLATCTYNWALPNNTTLLDGATYWIDVNTVDYFPKGAADADTNATVWFSINNRLATGQATRDLMGLVGMVLAGLVLLGGLASIVILKTDIAKTAIVTVVAAIAVAICSMVIGTILIPL